LEPDDSASKNCPVSAELIAYVRSARSSIMASAALGMAVSRRQTGIDQKAVARRS
jgi:hypothetical protein